MRKDVKTGMLAGTVLALVAVVWFCAKHQVVQTPVINFEPPKLSQQEKIEAEEQLIKISQPHAQEPNDAEQLTIHTVTAGQTLSDISKIYYNSTSGWKKIYEANKEKLPRGPDSIRAGMKLVIPE